MDTTDKMSTSSQKRKYQPDVLDVLQQPEMKKPKLNNPISAVDSSTVPHLLTLTQEIRDTIYEYVYLPMTITYKDKKYVAFPPRLTAVCKQLRSEIEDRLHSRQFQETIFSLRKHFLDPVEMRPRCDAKWRDLIETPRSTEYAPKNQHYSHILVEVRAPHGMLHRGGFEFTGDLAQTFNVHWYRSGRYSIPVVLLA